MSKSTSRVDKLNEIAGQYRDGLNAKERTMYEEKLKVIGGEDPYDMKASVWSENINLLPSVTYPDVVNYLLFSSSKYTCKNLKNFTELDAYKILSSGCVKKVTWRLINDKHLIIAKVLNSQIIGEEILKPWILADNTGCIVGSHCTCMEDLDEVCTHVAALLFATEATVQFPESQIVSTENIHWLVPLSAEGLPLSEIDFTPAKTMVDDSSTSGPVSAPSTPQKTIPKISEERYAKFFKALHESGSKSVILSLIPPYSDQFIPKPK